MEEDHDPQHTQTATTQPAICFPSYVVAICPFIFDCTHNFWSFINKFPRTFTFIVAFSYYPKKPCDSHVLNQRGPILFKKSKLNF